MTCDVTGCDRVMAATVAGGADLCVGHLAELRELHRLETDGADDGALDDFYAALPIDRPDASLATNETVEGDGGPGYRTHHPDSASEPYPTTTEG